MKISGWCAPIFGTTESPRAHATCEERIRRELLTCDCAGHAESPSVERDPLADDAATWENGTSPTGAETPAGSDHLTLSKNERG